MGAGAWVTDSAKGEREGKKEPGAGNWSRREVEILLFDN